MGMMFEMRIISPCAELTLVLPAGGPGIMSDAAMMATASVTAYVGGAVPPVDRRKSAVALPSPEWKKK
jgi:hypothetical protein